MEELRFTVRILNPTLVERLEQEEDTVFAARIKSLIVKELGKWNENINRADVHVIEEPIKKERY